MKGDIIGYKFVKDHLIRSQLTPIMKMITFFGGGVSLISTAIILFIIIKNKKIGTLICLNLIIITVLNQLLKFIVERQDQHHIES